LKKVLSHIKDVFILRIIDKYRFNRTIEALKRFSDLAANDIQFHSKILGDY